VIVRDAYGPGDNGAYGPLDEYPTNSWEHSDHFRDVVFVAVAVAGGGGGGGGGDDSDGSDADGDGNAGDVAPGDGDGGISCAARAASAGHPRRGELAAAVLIVGVTILRRRRIVTGMRST
jgi:hypothetical protein